MTRPSMSVGSHVKAFKLELKLWSEWNSNGSKHETEPIELSSAWLSGQLATSCDVKKNESSEEELQLQICLHDLDRLLLSRCEIDISDYRSSSFVLPVPHWTVLANLIENNLHIMWEARVRYQLPGEEESQLSVSKRCGRLLPVGHSIKDLPPQPNFKDDLQIEAEELPMPILPKELENLERNPAMSWYKHFFCTINLTAEFVWASSFWLDLFIPNYSSATLCNDCANQARKPGTASNIHVCVNPHELVNVLSQNGICINFRTDPLFVEAVAASTRGHMNQAEMQFTSGNHVSTPTRFPVKCYGVFAFPGVFYVRQDQKKMEFIGPLDSTKCQYFDLVGSAVGSFQVDLWDPINGQLNQSKMWEANPGGMVFHSPGLYVISGRIMLTGPERCFSLNPETSKENHTGPQIQLPSPIHLACRQGLISLSLHVKVPIKK
ncbi:hypothetical protein Ciccas_007577 [Cichlidogyrus casuarinus]|uniref:Uncharacterized protein n=1 Tax=Cichlidogyrus casuarinus TaxID=1844966 RepID=A0ABD2Q353_9PLAT